MIGVGITTLNRPHVFQQCLDAVKAHTPGAFIVVVDDGSDNPVPGAYRNPLPTGIAAAKNDCLRLLTDNPAVEHIFLLDDDVIVGENWAQPFLTHPEQHLCFQPSLENVRCRRCRQPTLHVYDTMRGQMACTVCDPMHIIWRDDQSFAVQWGSGAVLYYSRACINRIGGMRRQFGRYGYEHWEHSFRARNTGFCTHPFTSVTSNIRLLDAEVRGQSCLTRQERQSSNWAVFQHFSGSSDHVDFTPTPQRHLTVCSPWRATPDRLLGRTKAQEWWQSHGFTVVEADSDPSKPFLCNQARNNAVKQTSDDVIVLADGDTIPHSILQITAAVDLCANDEADIVWPFNIYRHIPDTAEDYPNAEIIAEYRHGSPGGIIVFRRDAYWSINGYDEKFTPGAWAWDDTAFMYAAQTLLRTRRIPGLVYSFDHQVDNAGRPGRVLDESPNKPRYKLYEFANKKPDVMRELVK